MCSSSATRAAGYLCTSPDEAIQKFRSVRGMRPIWGQGQAHESRILETLYNLWRERVDRLLIAVAGRRLVVQWYLLHDFLVPRCC
jgi:hypothetical protein